MTTGGWTEIGWDLRTVLRSLRRSPLFTLAAVASLALGVGGVATAYAVADRLLLRPLPGVADPETLVEIVPEGMSYPAFLDLAEGMGSLEGLAAHRVRRVALDAGPGTAPRPVEAGVVSGSYFDVLGVTAALGRTLIPADDVPGAPPVAVLSHSLWTEMGARRDALGSELRANGAVFRVVGVVADDFQGLRLGVRPSFWIPVESWNAASLGRTPDVRSRGWGWMAVVGRVRAGTELAAVTAEARSVAERIAALDPAFERFQGEVSVVPARVTAGGVLGTMLTPLLAALAGVVALALLAAAVNVANLLLARATRRSQELGIRAALGAGRARLGRLLALESAVLACLGLVAGFLLSAVALHALGGLRLPGGVDLSDAALHVDGRLLLLASGVLVLVTMLIGVAPALTAIRMDPGRLAPGRGTTGSRVSLRLRSGFVSLQVAVSVVLLAGTALLGRSLLEALEVDLGFDPSDLGVVMVDASLFQDDQPSATRAMTQLVGAFRDSPGIIAASWAMVAPLTQDEDRVTFSILGQDMGDPTPTVEVNAVSADFFRAAGIPLVRGDGEALREPIDEPLLVVNEAMAERYWPDGDPVEARVQIMDAELAVVAVAADTRFHGFASEPEPFAFIVQPDPVVTYVNVVLRGGGAGAALASARSIAAGVDRRLVVAEARTGPALVEDLLAPQRLGSVVLLLFSGLAITLALTGVWGVVAYSVGARKREFGVRLSLGARSSDVTAGVLRRSLAPLVGGTLLGLGASLALTRGTAHLLFGVPDDEFLAPIVAAGLVLASALLATWIPARQAGKVAPVTVLSAD